ncbi:MAG TPA: DinB family protein [Candidatus Polarisedimenticolia bacterium]|nr:DinB family protein [Candidatus Polarisedimenticolia bacterium]
MQETAEQYRERMYSYVDGRDPVKLQTAAPGKLAKLLKGLSAAKARKRPEPQKWSIAEIVAHLADAELVGGYRVRAILGAPGAAIQAFDQDAWAEALQYNQSDTRKSFEQYRALREANLALLKSLSPEQWKHQGMHSERGPESVETIVRMFAGHDLNHFAQIERILGEKSVRKKR